MSTSAELPDERRVEEARSAIGALSEEAAAALEASVRMLRERWR